MKKTIRNAKIVLRACPRCNGDLFPDEFEEDFACLQCGRRFEVAAVHEIMESRQSVTELVAGEKELVNAA
jgi:predicted RNA-binding Zn-ribbon protein involved in translation (DUF1610 family)